MKQDTSLVRPTPRALLLTPIAPAPTGNGLAMRAALVAEGLGRAAELYTAVVPVADPGVGPERMHWITERSMSAAIVPLPDPAAAASDWLAYPAGRRAVAAVQSLPARARLASPGCGEVAARRLECAEFDVIYVLRQYLAGVAVPFLARTPETLSVLDIDEDDEVVLRAIAELRQRRGEVRIAAEIRAEADAYGRFAANCLSWFDWVLSASEREVAALRARHALENSMALVNALRPSLDLTPCPGSASPPVRLVYVGNMNYFPNLDAVERLAKGVLPALRRSLPDVQLDIIGAGGGKAVAGLRVCDSVIVHGPVADLRPFYRSASVTVVPLRVGGGSRLKILEAFANSVPVVASPEAAAGLDVNDGQQLLLAASDEALARAALRVVTDAALARSLTTNAAAFVAERHDADDVAKRLAAFVRCALAQYRPGRG